MYVLVTRLVTDCVAYMLLTVYAFMLTILILSIVHYSFPDLYYTVLHSSHSLFRECADDLACPLAQFDPLQAPTPPNRTR
jgi:hypothetical protein